MKAAESFRQLRYRHGAYRGLGEGAVERQVDLRQPRRCRKAALVLEVVTAKCADVFEGTRLEAYHPFASDELRVHDRFALWLEDRLVEAGRQHVDQVDIGGELVVLLLGDAGGDKDTEVADLVVNGVDDGLTVSADLVDAVIEVEDPVERLLRWSDVVAPRAEHHDR